MKHLHVKLDELLKDTAICRLWLFTAFLSLVTMCILVACYCNVQLQDAVVGLKITTAALGLSVAAFALMGGVFPCVPCLGQAGSNTACVNDCPLPVLVLFLGAFLAILLIEYTGFAVPFLCQGAAAGLLVYETKTVMTRNATASEVSNASKATLVAGSVVAVLTTTSVVVLNCLWCRVAATAREPERKYLTYEERETRKRERAERCRQAQAEYEAIVREEEEELSRKAAVREI